MMPTEKQSDDNSRIGQKSSNRYIDVLAKKDNKSIANNLKTQRKDSLSPRK